MSSCWRCAFVLLIFISSLYAQTATPNPSAPVATFKSKVRVVLLDVVVTAGKDDAVSGLKKKDFEVFEDGKPQNISTFEEHKAAPLTQIKLPPMPPGVYTNFPTVQTSDSVNVLLLDGLNTQTRDQVWVHTQMVKYLKTIPPGTRVAIFTLASRLRMVQPITSDSTQLPAALNDKKSGVWGPHPSLLLQSEMDKQADHDAIEFKKSEEQVQLSGPNSEGTSVQAAISPINAIQEFMAESASFQTVVRTRVTLQSLQQLARYLSDIPGRKNIIWFSSAFPTGILPDADASDPFATVEDLHEEVHKTADMLAENQVALYPIGAQGLAINQVYEANAAETSRTRPSLMTQDQVSQMRSELGENASSQAAMEILAKDSGGKATYDTNGLGDALIQDIKNGSNYYSISYSPANQTMDGHYRKIEVKVVESKYKLAYRRGYYADDPNAKQVAAQNQPDPLLPLMGVNLPNFSQIVYKVRVLPSNPQPQPDAPNLGSNADLKGPRTRYTADFAIAIQDLKLDLTPDGMRHGNVELMMVAYDHQGKPLNMVIKQAGLLLKPDVYQSMEKVGLQLKSEIDVPAGNVLLRTGIFDANASQAGTLLIPLGGATLQAHNNPN